MSEPERTNLLLVDDREENLVALNAILEPLGQNLILARSGEDALKELLVRDFAAILLDVQMPGMDGFETAEVIKQRERTRHTPILFLTAINKDARHVFRGYSTGAVDYIFKPFDPEILRSKVAVFIDLYRKTEEIRRQAELLGRHELAQTRAESEERYRQLADAMPQIVWTADPAGKATYYNERWFEYTGMTHEEADSTAWRRVLHPEDLPRVASRRDETLETGEVFEVEYRFRAADGTYRWHLGRAVPIRGDDGQIEFWVGTATDIDDRKRTEEAQRFLLETGAELATSLDYRRTLARVAQAAVPGIADWCAVHVVGEDGSLEQLAVEHVDPKKVEFARELQRRYPEPTEKASGIPYVVRTGKPELVSEIPDELLERVAADDLHLALLRELGLRSMLIVPLTVRDRVLGAIAFVQAESGRVYGEADLALAEELARRAAIAIENSQLYEQAERRARAAQALETIADGVFLVDAGGAIRLWNPAAAAITGLPEERVLGRRPGEVIPGWAELEPTIPVAAGAPQAARAETLPLELEGREAWLSISAVGSTEGTVYAFRDLTEERGLEQMKTDFVATVSHELRTPLAAIYGAAVTVRREDVELEEELKNRLLGVIEEESDRLARIVNDLLLASHLDSGRLTLNIELCDAREIVDGVMDAARTYLPDGMELELQMIEAVPQIQADADQLRQVLANLIDNAVKYSPGGGPVTVSVEAANGSVRFAVRDRGLGIPTKERQRIFEKFYRLDPNMTRGIGGTGLGLYICRELVGRLGGKIWVEPNEQEGSTFVVELPAAESARRSNTPAARASAG